MAVIFGGSLAFPSQFFHLIIKKELILLLLDFLFAGTSKAAEPYKVGKRTTETMVEILNLDKTEIISIDTISNQEFTEVTEFHH